MHFFLNHLFSFMWQSLCVLKRRVNALAKHKHVCIEIGN